MITKQVRVTEWVDVTIDETKFTPEFMKEFREYMMPYDTLDDHIEHLAQMEVIGGFTDFDRFLEGYGTVADMGIKCNIVDSETEIAPHTY